MSKLVLLLVCVLFLPNLSKAISSCNGPCKTLNDCTGQLICINDDPDVGARLCSNCKPSGNLNCDGKSFPQFECSPPVTPSTKAILTNNDFAQGGDEKFHSNSELIVALSTGWYNGGSRCGKKIRITAGKNGRSVLAKVVDQCDSINGCDQEHAHQPPCRNNIGVERFGT